MVYLILGAAAVLLMVVTVIVRSLPGSSWTGAALTAWLFLALVLSISWVLRRPHGLGLRRIDMLWRADRLSALLLVKLLLAVAAIIVLVTILFVLE
jgi:hypothetical protein